ncbi:acyltransferase family protein [Kineococcus sp. TBRC 1896]|uniref:Acyltransferase family protein n=1 Tax=Kineococcus mangrovi TaxID=1660183 RepID=A0ABV4HXT2_9ACTN
MNASRRLTWADQVKGLAIAMVVVFHVSLYLDPVGVDAVIGRLKVPFELFPMPAFFVIAGMAAAGHGRLGVSAVLRRRVLPLAYVYFLWSLLRTVFYLLVPGLQGGLGDLPADEWRTVALLPVWPSSSYWFLFALALFTMLRRLVAALPPAVQLGGSAVVSAVFSSGIVRVDNVGWTRIGSLFVFFVAGALLAPRLKRLVDASRPWHVLPIALGVLVFTAALLTGLRHVPGITLAGQVLAVAGGIVLVAHLPVGRVRDGLTTLGRNSYGVYLLHLFPIVLVTSALRLVDPAWPRPVDVTVQLGLSAAVLWLSWRLALVATRFRWLFAPPERFVRAGRSRREPRSTVGAK